MSPALLVNNTSQQQIVKGALACPGVGRGEGERRSHIKRTVVLAISLRGFKKFLVPLGLKRSTAGAFVVTSYNLH